MLLYYMPRKCVTFFFSPLKLASFLEQLIEWQGPFSQPADETAQCCESSGELLHTFDVGWFLHLSDCLDFFGVCFDSPGRDHVSEKFSGWDAEHTLFWVELDSLLVEGCECLAEVVEQCVCTVGFDDDVVDVDMDVPAYLVSQSCLHHPLVCGSCIFESKGHCPVAEYAVGGDERGEFFILFLHPDLIVS